MFLVFSQLLLFIASIKLHIKLNLMGNKNEY